MPPQADAASRQTALETLRKAQSLRFQRLDMLTRYVSGDQYEGRVPFYDAGDTPLLERAPCFVYPIAAFAIDSHASLVLGDGRFPALTTHGDEDDADEDTEDDDVETPPSSRKGATATTAHTDTGLDEKDSRQLDRLLRKIAKQVHLQPTARCDLEAALGCGSSPAVVSVRQGRLHVSLLDAKNCTAKREDPSDPDAVTSLEVRYPYIDEVMEHGKLVAKCFVYRRVIDDKADTTFAPFPGDVYTAEMPESSWTPAKGGVIAHNLGFCPVRWYRCMPRDMGGRRLDDGTALHMRLLDEITALDFAISQRIRAVLYTTDPIILEIGVDKDYEPAALVRVARQEFLSADSAFKTLDGPGQMTAMANEAKNRQWGGGGNNGGGVKLGRKRAPGMAYQYTDANAKVSFLTLPGDALAAAHKNADDIEAKLCEALHWVPIDPKTMPLSGNLSGKALEWLHKKQLDFCTQLRTDYGEHGLLSLVSLLLRVAYTIGARGEGLYLDGLAAALPILKRFDREQFVGGAGDQGAKRKVWLLPEIDLVWPPFFASTDADAKAIGERVIADKAAGLITDRNAVEKIAPFYGITNIDAHMAKLEAAKAAATAAEHDAAAQLQASVAAGAATARRLPAAATAAPRLAPVAGTAPPSAAAPLRASRMGNRMPPPRAPALVA